MGFKVAKTYTNYSYDEEKAFTKDGKLYVKATCKCDNCTNGVYVARIENGHIVPHPNCGGVCFRCGGTGVISKNIRLYTDKEFETMERANERAKEKKEKAFQEKLKAEYADKKADWLKKNGYNKNEVTFVYFPKDSFEIKEQLKEDGFTFDRTLLWHCAEVPNGYEDRVFEVAFEEIGQYQPNGEGSYYTTSKDKVAEMMREHRPAPVSKWIGEEKERLYDLSVKVKGIVKYNSMYGEGSIVTFETEDGNICKWFTQTYLSFVVGDNLIINGTVKELINDKYEDDAEVTILTRCKIVEK